MSRLASGSETFFSQTLKDVRLWLRVFLCRINQQLIQALFQTICTSQRFFPDLSNSLIFWLKKAHDQ